MAQSRAPYPEANGTIENFCVCVIVCVCFHECKPVFSVCVFERKRENRMVEE